MNQNAIALVVFGAIGVAGIVAYENRDKVSGLHWPSVLVPENKAETDAKQILPNVAGFYRQAQADWGSGKYDAKNPAPFIALAKQAHGQALAQSLHEEFQPIQDAMSTVDSSGKRVPNPNATNQSIGDACGKVADALSGK